MDWVDGLFSFLGGDGFGDAGFFIYNSWLSDRFATRIVTSSRTSI